MNASKEECQAAKVDFERIVESHGSLLVTHRGSVEGVRAFLAAAERKLPSEAAFARARNQRAAADRDEEIQP